MSFRGRTSTHTSIIGRSIIGRAFAAIATATLLSIAAGTIGSAAIAQIPGVPAIPKIPAFLPMVDAVPEGDTLPIDGLWRISGIGKKIRIERGRAYAVDTWLHMFVLEVQPDMVVMQNFERTGPGRYTADDLPLQGQATFTLTRDGNIRVVVQSMFGPIPYTLTKRRADDRDALEDEIAAMTSGGRDRDRDRNSDRDRDRDRDRDQDRRSDRDNDRNNDRDRDQNRDRDSDRDRNSDRNSDRADDSRTDGGGALADCKKLGVDSRTGDVVCKD